MGSTPVAGLGRIGLRLESYEGRISKGPQSERGPAYLVQDTSGTVSDLSTIAFGLDMSAPHHVMGSERFDLALTRLIGEPECPSPNGLHRVLVFRADWFQIEFGNKNPRRFGYRIQASDGSSPLITCTILRARAEITSHSGATVGTHFEACFYQLRTLAPSGSRPFGLRPAGPQQNVNLFLREP
jgi:hypothetical protein